MLEILCASNDGEAAPLKSQWYGLLSKTIKNSTIANLGEAAGIGSHP